MQDVQILTRKGRVETAFEIARVFVYGNRWQANAAWCDRCESYVPMVTALTAAELDRTTSEAIAGRVEAMELHHWLTDDGTIFICLSSLLGAGESSTAAEAIC